MTCLSSDVTVATSCPLPPHFLPLLPFTSLSLQLRISTCVFVDVRVFVFLPYKVATEYEAEHKDEDPCPKDHHVDVERQVLKRHGWHSARLIGEDQSQTAEAP